MNETKRKKNELGLNREIKLTAKWYLFPRGGHERLHGRSLTRFCAAQIAVRAFDQHISLRYRLLPFLLSICSNPIEASEWEILSRCRSVLRETLFHLQFMNAVEAIKWQIRSVVLIPSATMLKGKFTNPKAIL